MRTNFQFSCDPPLARLRVTGELDFTTRDQLLDVFASLSCRRCNRVELDLDGITFIDLSALEVLDQEQRRLTESGGTLQVVAASAFYHFVVDVADFPSLRPPIAQAPRLTLLRNDSSHARGGGGRRGNAHIR